MKLEHWLIDNKMSKTKLAQELDIHRCTFYRLLKNPPKMFILAIHTITKGEVTHKDWDNVKA